MLMSHRISITADWFYQAPTSCCNWMRVQVVIHFPPHVQKEVGTNWLMGLGILEVVFGEALVRVAAS